MSTLVFVAIVYFFCFFFHTCTFSVGPTPLASPLERCYHTLSPLSPLGPDTPCNTQYYYI